MNVAGIDFSTRYVDIVLLDENDNTACWKRCDIRVPGRAFYAARRVPDALPTASWWERNGVYLIGIEGNYRGRPNIVKALSLIEGAIVARLPRDITVLETPEEEWKRVFCGHAKATKQDVLVRAVRRGFFPVPPVQDAYDAFAIAWATRELNNQAIAKEDNAA